MATVCLITVAGCTPSPHDLVARGQNEKLKNLLKGQPDKVQLVDRLRKTALHTAVSARNIDAMALLVEHGANVNAADKTGMTPLHVAAMLGRREEAGWLLDHGALIDSKDTFGDTPAHTAAVFGQGGALKLLIERGASLGSPNNAGKFPIDLARENRHDRVVALIMPLTEEASAGKKGEGAV